MNAFKLKTLVFAAALVGSASAMAGSATTTLSNTTAITANCTFTASGFTNTYDPIVTNASTPVKDATASITYTCTNGGTGAKIALNDGLNAASGSTDDSPLARLKGGTTGDYLNYAMYQDSGYGQIWAYDPAVNEVSATEDGGPHTVTVYTEIPAGQNVHVDTYTDTVTATITF
jgi:spore coat protein U-like protein